jgi:hypothetical protein
VIVFEMFLGGIGATHGVFRVLGLGCGRVFCSAAILVKVKMLLYVLCRLLGEWSYGVGLSILVGMSDQQPRFVLDWYLFKN